MRIKNLLLLVAVLASFASARAQSINCNSFCLTNISFDSVDADRLNLHLFLNGSSSDFINYPYVTAIVDSNGDTVATGGMEFFGQFGNTHQTYTATTTTLATLPPDFSCIVYFHYDTIDCALPYPCEAATATHSSTIKRGVSISPNPSNGLFNLQIEGNLNRYSFIEVLDVNGKRVYNSPIQSSNNAIDLSSFAKGIYFVRVQGCYEVLNFKVISQ